VHTALTDGVGISGFEQVRRGRQHLGALHRNLPERAHLVHYPKAAAVRGDGQVVAVDHDVAHRGHRHVVLQWLPLRPVVEGYIYAQFGGSVQQALGLRVFPDAVYVGAFGDSRDHILPGLAAVVRAIDIGLVVANAVAVHRRVGRFDLEVSGVDLGHLAPRRHG